MRKTICILLLLLLASCSNKSYNLESDNSEKIDNDIIEKEPIVIEEEKENIGLSLFLYDNNYHNKKRLDDTIYLDFINGRDIGSFELFLTDDEVINGKSFKDTWNYYYNKYDTVKNYKVGFNIKFMLKDGTSKESNFLEPDIFKFSPYFYVYLYDDVNQKDGAFYSHLESINDDTIITSMKIYAADGINDVENFIISVFLYKDESDFDEDDNYIGNYLKVIRVKRKI